MEKNHVYKVIRLITRIILSFYFLYFNQANCIDSQIDYIVVEKSKRKMSLYNKDKVVKTYTIALGFNPKGHKEKQGDGKTPEGRYKICAKNSNSSFCKSLRISYPAFKDIASARKKCIDPGGDIMIHGLGKNFSYLGNAHTIKDWTLGCIALTDIEINEVYSSVKIGTVIEIKA